MITLRNMTEQDTAAVLQLTITEEQTGYVSPIAQILTRGTPSREYHLLEAEGTVVGFFIIDTAYAQQYPFAQPGDLGLLAYFVDATHQGKGFGTAGVQALASYLHTHYPRACAVVLTVNCRNLPAIKSYVQGGFADTQELYHGGRSGPQHIMRMPLRGVGKWGGASVRSRLAAPRSAPASALTTACRATADSVRSCLALAACRA